MEEQLKELNEKIERLEKKIDSQFADRFSWFIIGGLAAWAIIRLLGLL